MQDTQDLFILLDLRGLTLHAYHSGTDPESVVKNVNSPEHTLNNFIDRYLLPITKIAPLNHIIAVNDAGSLYRTGLNADYKANRKAKPQDPEIKAAHEISRQAIRNLLHSLGIPQCHVPGTEADDVIAYLAQNLPGQKLIYTVDGDLVALANRDTTVFLKGEPASVYKYKYDKTIKGKKEKRTIEVLPRHVTLFKSIVGDTSDDIAGVNGMGPDVWVKMIEEFGLDGLDELIDIMESEDFGKLRRFADQQKHPILLKLADNMSQWRNSYLLAKLRPELVNARQGKEFTRIKWEKRLPSLERLKKLEETANARWLEMTLGHLLPKQYLITAKDWDDTVLPEAERLFKDSRFVSLDWETWAPRHEPFEIAGRGNYVDMLSSRITSAGFTCGENLEHTFFFQFEHADEENNIPKRHLIELLERIPPDRPIIAQNAIFERTVLLNELGYDLPNLHDTKVMASHVDESMPAGLKEMSKQHLNYNQLRYEDVIEPGKTMKDYTGLHVFKYGADDPLVTGHIYDLFRIILLLEGTWDFVRENEFAAIYQLSEAFMAGVEIDYEEVERQRVEDQLTFDTNLAKVREILDANVNETTIEAGARNWMEEELIPNVVAEGKYVIKLLTDIVKKNNAVDLIKADKMLMAWVGETVAAGVELEEYTQTVQEEVMNRTRYARGSDKNLTMWDSALAAATYRPFKKWQKPATFQFSVGKLNQLAEHFGLPNWPTPSVTYDEDGNELVPDVAKEWAVHAANLTSGGLLTTPQEHYLSMVVEAQKLEKTKRTKSEAYKYLRDTYVENFEGGWDQEGTELSLDSPKQMQELLYAMLGLPIRIRAFEPSKGRELRNLDGAAQTNKDAIATAIAFGDATDWKKDVLLLLQEAKAALTRIKFFYTKFPLWKHPIDGLIHPQFNSTGTETRRPSGSSPNLLQLSKKGEGVKVRRCIVPNSKLGHDLVGSIDWRAQELRVLASLSDDPTMVACYIGDNLLDLHSVTAAYMMGLSYEEFMAQMSGNDPKLAKLASDIRKSAKNVNFGSVYGIGGAKLARQLLVSPEEAKAFLDAKKAAYPGVEEWKVDVKSRLHATGIVRTQFGTIKHVYNKLVSNDEGLVSYYERASVNQLIQGVCADYLKKVLRDLWVMRTFQRFGASLIAPIYDEVVFSFHHSVAVPLYFELCDTMKQGIPGLKIPMLVAPALGPTFGDQIEILADDDNDLTEEKILAAVDKALVRDEEKEAA